MVVLITGSLGQLGSELATALRGRYGLDRVIITDIRDDVNRDLISQGPFYKLDCSDGKRLSEIVRRHKVDTIYHLAALLSATAESRPRMPGG